MSAVHHIEIWTTDLDRTSVEWDWLFTGLDWAPFQCWSTGRSWRAPDGAYVVLEESPDLEPLPYRRKAPGLNHLAVNASREVVDRLAHEGAHHGWTALFAESFPYAGGPDHYAAFLVNSQGFEVEIVAAGAATQL